MSEEKKIEAQIAEGIEKAETRTLEPHQAMNFLHATDGQGFEIAGASYNHTTETMGMAKGCLLENYKTQRSKYFLKAGKNNKLYEHYAGLYNECGLLRRVIAFLSDQFMTPYEFTENGLTLSPKSTEKAAIKRYGELNKMIGKLGLNPGAKKLIATRLYLYGFAPIQLTNSISSKNDVGYDLIRAHSIDPRYTRIGLTYQTQEGLYFPQHIVSSPNTRFSTKNLNYFPIEESNLYGYGYKWRNVFGEKSENFDLGIYEKFLADGMKDETFDVAAEKDINRRKNMSSKGKLTGLVSYYLAQIPDAVNSFIPVAYWASESGVNTLYSYSKMTQIKGGFMKRSLFKSYIIIIARELRKGKYPDDYHIEAYRGKKEEDVWRETEEKMILDKTGAKNAGGVIIQRDYAPNAKDTKPYMQILEIPQINNEKFLEYLDKGYDKRGCFEMGVDSEILSLTEAKSGFSNKSATLLFKYLVMQEGVGKMVREPVLHLTNFITSKKEEFNEIEAISFADSKVLSFLKKSVSEQEGDKAIGVLEQLAYSRDFKKLMQSIVAKEGKKNRNELAKRIDSLIDNKMQEYGVQ